MLQCLGKRAEEGFVSWELSSNREMDGSSWNSRECYCPDSFCAHQLTQDLGATLSFASSASEKNPHHKETYSEEGQSKDWIERWIYPRRQQKWRLRSWIFRNAPGLCPLRTQPWWALRLDLSRTWPEQDQTPQASPRKPDTLVCLKHIQMPFPPQKTLFLLGQNSSISGRPNSRHFCRLRGIPAAGRLSDVACGWAFAHSLAISLQAVGARVGQVSQAICSSNSGNFIAQKWHSARRGEREELIVVCLHTLTKLLLMNQREKSGEVTLGGHRRLVFANKYEHLQSCCGLMPVTVLCAISSKHMNFQ